MGVSKMGNGSKSSNRAQGGDLEVLVPGLREPLEHHQLPAPAPAPRPRVTRRAPGARAPATTGAAVEGGWAVRGSSVGGARRARASSSTESSPRTSGKRLRSGAPVPSRCSSPGARTSVARWRTLTRGSAASSPTGRLPSPTSTCGPAPGVSAGERKFKELKFKELPHPRSPHPRRELKLSAPRAAAGRARLVRGEGRGVSD